jgi:hypothetical protein
MIKSIRLMAALFIVFHFTTGSARAQPVVCCPGGNSSIVSWYAPNSWSPATVPNSGLNAWIEQGSAYISSPGASVNEVWIGKGAIGNEGGLSVIRVGSEFPAGTLTSNVAVIGDEGENVIGMADVYGNNATWTNSGVMLVGYKSQLGPNGKTNSLRIRSGGSVSSGGGYIGQLQNARGRVTVDGIYSALLLEPALRGTPAPSSASPMPVLAR